MYPLLATFLNHCIDPCHSDGPRGSAARKPCWYDRLKFTVYDETAVDKVEGASPVKPDLVGGLDLGPDERATWSPQETLTK